MKVVAVILLRSYMKYEEMALVALVAKKEEQMCAAVETVISVTYQRALGNAAAINCTDL